VMDAAPRKINSSMASLPDYEIENDGHQNGDRQQG